MAVLTFYSRIDKGPTIENKKFRTQMINQYSFNGQSLQAHDQVMVNVLLCIQRER